MSPIFFLSIAIGLALSVWIVMRLLPNKERDELPPHMRAMCIPCMIFPIIASGIMLVMIHQFYVMDGWALAFAWAIGAFIIFALAMTLRYSRKGWFNVLLLSLNLFLSYAYFFFLLLVIIYPGGGSI